MCTGLCLGVVGGADGEPLRVGEGGGLPPQRPPDDARRGGGSHELPQVSLLPSCSLG